MSDKIPATYRKLVVNKLTTNFREAVSIVTSPIGKPEPNEVLVRTRYVGINATDVNITAGKYFTDGVLPFELGFEGVGEIAAVGSKVTNLQVGQPVAYVFMKSYAEYVCVPQENIFPIPEVKPEYVGLIVGGLTATIGLDKAARITGGETVLVTAAAGGTGHIAVQWAKAAGCHVIGTCSSDQKVEILKELGCDRALNYKTENLEEVLKEEYPTGIDVIWETIGGNMFKTCLQNLAEKGRLLVVGGITGYKSDQLMPKLDLSELPGFLITKSAAVQGFLVLHYQNCYATYFNYLLDRYKQNELTVVLDTGKNTSDGEFIGLEGITRGVEHLHSGKNIGKVIVRIP